MSRLFRLLVLCIGLSAGILAIASVLGGLWLATLAALLIGAGWLAAERQDWSHAAAPAFVGLLIVAAFAILAGLSSFWIAPAGLFALAGWDLSRFRQRLRAAGERPTAALEALHVRRLLWVCGVGFILAELANLIHFQLRFVLVFILGLASFLALYILAARLARPAGEQPVEKTP